MKRGETCVEAGTGESRLLLIFCIAHFFLVREKQKVLFSSKIGFCLRNLCAVDKTKRRSPRLIRKRFHNMSQLIVYNEQQEEAFRRAKVPCLSVISCKENNRNYNVTTIGSQPKFLDSNSVLIQPFSLNQVPGRKKRS